MTKSGNDITASQPLAGIVVVELGHSVAAPYGAQILGDLGATVVKIENPKGGDDARNWGPPFWHGAAVAFQGLNRNKFSAAVDLKDAGQLAALKTYIVERADIVLQNMRPGLVSSLGIGPELRRENPRLIYCNMGAFGARGPLKDRPGYDPLMQAFGGIMSVTGEEGRPPVRVGPSLVDMGTGMWAVIGALAALRRRDETGEGCEIDTSLYETAVTWVHNHVAGYFATGRVPGRRGSENPGLVPYKVFEASDGYILIAAGNDNLFRRLSAALGHPEWAEEGRYAANPDRVRDRATVNAMVQEAVGARPRAHWLAVLEEAGVPSAPLQSVDQVVNHEQTEALGLIQRMPEGEMSFTGLPVSFDGERPSPRRGPPELGAHTGMVTGGGKGDD